MPYIRQIDRAKYQDSMKNLLGLLADVSEVPAVKGEYFGYYVRRLLIQYINCPIVDRLSRGVFHFNNFSDVNKKLLTNTADQVAVLIGQGSALETAGHLNYCISTPLWAMLGCYKGIQTANYGMRAYLKGICIQLQKITDDLFIPPKNDAKPKEITEAIIAERKKWVIQGVISDVIDEAYRRWTAEYEVAKMRENGDIFNGGELWVV